MKNVLKVILVMIFLFTMTACGDYSTQNTPVTPHQEPIPQEKNKKEEPKKEEAQTKEVYIRYTASMVFNNHVGNSWSTWVEVGGVKYNTSQKINVTGKKSITVKAVTCEADSIPDIGSSNITIPIEKGTYSCNVLVIENRGRYSGNGAQWKFTFYVE